jgi:basic membrane lipoprotein Med (substrate-binding protein (PBP1-ABC) superfamily)
MNNRLLKNTILTSTLLLASGFIYAETAEATNTERGLAIAVESDKRDTGFSDQTANMVMELRNKHGDVSTRTIRIKTLEVIGDGDKSMSISNGYIYRH